MLRDRKILITGATGDVARAIAIDLAARNEVWGTAHPGDADKLALLEQHHVRPFSWALGGDDFTGLPDDFDYVIHAAYTVLTVATDYDAAVRENAEGTGLLMAHVRRARAFLYISSLSAYSTLADNSTPRRETDALGSHPPFAPSYSIGKVATEAVVRTLGRICNLPVTIGRLGMHYGLTCSGVPDMVFKTMLAGEPVVVPPRGISFCTPTHNGDVVAQVEPLLNAASVPATIVNWTGDEAVDERDLFDHMARIAGLAPDFVENENAGFRGGVADTTRRRLITGPARYHWKEAIAEMIRCRYPHLALAGAERGAAPE